MVVIAVVFVVHGLVVDIGIVVVIIVGHRKLTLTFVQNFNNNCQTPG